MRSIVPGNPPYRRLALRPAAAIICAGIVLCCSSANGPARYYLPPGSPSNIVLGLENFINDEAGRYRGKTAVLITNHSGVDREFRHAIDKLRRKGICIAAVMAPEHGLYGHQNVYDRESFHVDKSHDVIVYNLHHFDVTALRSMFSVADAVIFDVQDLGMRCFTYVSSLKLAMDALNGTGTELIVLDRPNPIGFLGIDGPDLDPEFYSREISAFPAPFIYNLTPGEAARYYRGRRAGKVNLRVVPMTNYRRDMYFHETMLAWIPPSPNLPDYRSAIVYTAVVMMEGINISIGRGTPNPFEFIGAPWMDPVETARDLNAMGMQNFRFRPVVFQPTFSLYQGKRCGGVQMHYAGGRFSPIEVSYRMVSYLKKRHPRFQWKHSGANYWVDYLAGTDLFRKSIDAGLDYERFEEKIRDGIRQYRRHRAPYLLY